MNKISLLILFVLLSGCVTNPGCLPKLPEKGEINLCAP